MLSQIKENLRETLRSAGVALSLFDLIEHTGVSADTLQTALNQLCEEGAAVITKKGKYAVPELLGLIPARASAMRSGAPIAIPLAGGESLRISGRSRLRTLPDDIILVRAAGIGECELVSIARRGKSELAGFIRIEQRQLRRPGKKRGRRTPSDAPETVRTLTATACDRRIPYPIVITDEDVPVRNDDIALLAIDRYPEGEQPILAHVLRVLGDKSDMRARLRVIAEDHQFPSEFPPEVLCEGNRFGKSVPESELTGREDLRGMTIFTIDGPFSKDYDDAVSLDRTPDGDWRLGVHIADVSHYVRPGSAIDREAQARGTSLYLPGLTVPMLPESLSNSLCSLMPDVDRLALSLFMVIRDGKIVDHHLARSVIHSCARLTYDRVNRLFDGDVDAVDASLHATLREMLALSHQLRARRFANGSIDLDLPEAEFVLDEENNPTDIFSAPRGEAERLIEDFMLAANETIAALARSVDLPLVYRVHEDPDPERLHVLERYLSSLNLRVHLGDAPHPGVLQQLLEDTKSLPAADSIRRMLLRSLQRARYSERPLGHYALAMRDYCHFTSPIRRYPDLIVHRMLKQLLAGAIHGDESSMAALAEECSAREQESTLAEREADDLMKARYMQNHIGWKYNGVVSGVTGWGLYVTLDNTVEGLVHIATLDDYYEFDRDRNQLVAPGSRNVFRLGDRVRIRVERADVERAEIDFSLIPTRRN